jgi:lipopolysaccharide/colanic/teichoic acid biosynthesis glycosyltransferase
MSLVGPRPERPFFVEKFKEEIPRYMVKHQVRPGMTGWAQINGYRGDTSINKRIDFDLYYIENWSIIFDIKILFMTIFKGFRDDNAY